MRIVVFGSLNFDTTLTVEHQPAWGETILAERASTAAGGKGANQAVAAARIGRSPVAMVGRVGADGAGAFLRAQLATSGVTDLVHTDPALATGGAFILRSPAGENAIVVAAGANDNVTVEDLAAMPDPEQPSVLVVQLEIPLAAVAGAIQHARRHGWHVLLNTAPVRPGAESLVDGVDMLVANEVEAAQLTGVTVLDAGDAATAGAILLQRGASRVAITLGAQGAVLVSRAGAWHAPAPVVDVVDTTAAGDAFVGALAVAMAEALADPDALALAVAAGSLATTRAGAQPSLPDRASVLSLAPTVGVETFAAVE